MNFKLDETLFVEQKGEGITKKVRITCDDRGFLEIGKLKAFGPSWTESAQNSELVRIENHDGRCAVFIDGEKVLSLPFHHLCDLAELFEIMRRRSKSKYKEPVRLWDGTVVKGLNHNQK